MRQFRFALLSICALAGLSASPGVLARTVCVATLPALLDAVQQFDNEVDRTTLVIKVVQGTYSVGAGLGAHSAYPYSVGLQLLGGYTAGCASRQVNPQNTILDGGNQANSHLAVIGDDDAGLLIEGLTFRNFRGSSNGPVVKLGLDVGTSDTALYQIRYSRFLNNTANQIVAMSGAQLRFVDNLVANNTLAGAGIRSAVYAEYTYDANSGLVANNNTIASNPGGSGLTVDTNAQLSSRITEIADNIIWGNGSTDLQMMDFSPLNPSLISYNLHGTYAGLPLSADNIIANPQFINAAANNFGLLLTSPAINSGAPIQLNGFPAHDLAGDARITGSRIDRGAFESSVDDRTGFIVTNAGDNGNNATPLAGSLRAAIKAANAASGPFRITFQIAGTCPRTLNFSGNMLDITGDVTIDGTSQAGWVGNSQYGRFDATLCLFVNGAGSTPWAFHVPAAAGSARLVVRGIMFAGFDDAAIKLEGGDNHLITGNQFGAIGFTVPSGSAVRVTGNSGGAQIGGFDDPASLNLIAGTSTAGVFLDNAAGGSVLGNNVIGFQVDGSGDGGNPIGVYMFNSPNNVLMYNFIGHSSGNGVAISGAPSTGTVVQYNVIGHGINGSLAANGGAGVSMLFGARNSTIGAPLPGTYGANDISYNGGPGVWVSTSGGAGNRILSNFVYGNGGLDIDLGAAGPTANQANPGSGANAAQNYPVLSQAIRTPTSSVTIGTLTSRPNTQYRIDVYLSAGCRADGRAIPNGPLGKYQVVTNAQGVAAFTGTVPVGAGVLVSSIGLTATDPSGNTSEIGNCIDEVVGSAPDALFGNGYE